LYYVDIIQKYNGLGRQYLDEFAKKVLILFAPDGEFQSFSNVILISYTADILYYQVYNHILVNVNGYSKISSVVCADALFPEESLAETDSVKLGTFSLM